MFYNRLFALDPTLEPLFATRDMSAQKLALVQALSLAVSGLEEPETLAPVLRALGHRHAGYGVRTAHYETVGAALLWTLEQGLGADATPRVLRAWATAYALISKQMIAGAAEAA